jgi:aarF domain-containing kinase
MSRSQDILGLIRGIQLVANASLKTQEAYLKHLWSHSSVREAVEKSAIQTSECGKKVMRNPGEELQNVGRILKETFERSSVVVDGIKQYTAASKNSSYPFNDLEISGGSKSFSSIKNIQNLDIASITLKELENLLAEHSKLRDVNLRIDTSNKVESQEKPTVKSEPKVKETLIEKPLRTSPQPQAEIVTNIANDEKQVESVMKFITNYDREPVAASSEKTKSVVQEVSKVLSLLGSK